MSQSLPSSTTPLSNMDSSMNFRLCTGVCYWVVLFSLNAQAQIPTGTQPLNIEGDLASQMVDGIDRFLLKQIEQVKAERAKHWNYDTTSLESYVGSIQPHRHRLGVLLGLRDQRVEPQAPYAAGRWDDPKVLAECDAYRVYRIRWPVLADPAPANANLTSIHGEGLLLVPTQKIIANVIALPDANQTPEQIAGLVAGVPPGAQFAKHLAERGCRVVVPMLINRERTKRNGRANLTNREYLYRPAFELGRQLIGYEIQKTQAILDWFEITSTSPELPTGVIGYGEGGWLALYGAAVDTRIDAVCVSGAFGPREECWQEPLDRNLFGVLKEFGAAELAAMVLPRNLIVEASHWPEVELNGDGGGPATLRTPAQQAVRDELALVQRLATKLNSVSKEHAQVTGLFDVGDLFCSRETLAVFLSNLTGINVAPEFESPAPATQVAKGIDLNEYIQSRQQRQVEEIDRHNQALYRESAHVRKEFFKKLETSSLQTFEQSAETYRKIFAEEVVGKFELPLLPFNARSRKTWETETWTGYEVLLDVFPDVFAYGVLLVPNDLKPGEKRPVVVCQHGLEGRPTDTFLNNHPAYHDFAAKLCEQGFITFAPQNCYIFEDRFRTLQRKANPLGKTLFSVIVPQHQQLVNWLKTQPYVDAEKIAFYGLSYGGKSAMRIPALVTDYCLSICSADFNEWVYKNVSTRDNFSYVWTGEYEIFEWDLGSRFNYAEMATLICPRPFMVERGHFDGVGTDEWVAFEYAKVRNLYAAQLGIGERTEIEWFVGPHTINGQGTFRFLNKHLKQEPASTNNNNDLK